MPALDHVFICCSTEAPEAAALARIGLKEGSPNTHPGQGTANRRFFFENAYLELLWVSDPEEAQGELARPTRLWERWSKRQGGACPFGVVLRPGAEAGDRDPPFATWSYHPPYLPPGLAIEVALGTPLGEPGFFYLRFARRPDDARREPITHAIPLTPITGVSIGIPAPGSRSTVALSVEATGVVSFSSTDEYVMTLAFDGDRRGNVVDLRPELPLVLRW
jgi:hypothetical protein